MPELPEVESVRRALLPLRGGVVVRAELRRADIAENVPARGVAAALLEGERIADLTRHGKQLAIVGSSGRVVCVQLGMSGQLLLTAGPPGVTHAHAAWRFADGGVLTFRDPRRFGGLSIYPSVDALRDQRWSRLGPDALTHREEDLASACRASRRKVKDLLLHQGALAGVGNIYADESLFEAGIRPTRRADRLRDGEVRALSRAIRAILERAVAAGGTTLRDYVQPDGAPGSAGALHRVYGRHGEPCPRCGTTLRHLTLSQRTTSYCPACQR
jgi:formamidopyrimidine-DNA glycosylase